MFNIFGFYFRAVIIFIQHSNFNWNLKNTLMQNKIFLKTWNDLKIIKIEEVAQMKSNLRNRKIEPSL